MNNAIPQFPASVRLTEQGLEDAALGKCYPLNETGAQLLSLVDGKRSVHVISSLAAEQYQHAQEEVQNDLQKLLRQLEIHYMLHMKIGWKEQFSLWLVCLRSLIVPPRHYRRFDPPHTANYVILLLWMYCIMLRLLWPLLTLGGIFIGLVSMPASISFAITVILYYLLIVGAMLLSIALHETSHLATLRWQRDRKCGFLATSSLMLKIVRPPLSNLRGEMLVSLSGPLTPVLIAVGIVIINHMYNHWFFWIIAVIFSLHALQLILPNPDIKNITRMIHSKG